MEKIKEPEKGKRGPVRRFFALLGPGLITDWCGMGLLLAKLPWNAKV